MSGSPAVAHQQVHLRHQHGLDAAVGQRDGVFNQPDQVGAELYRGFLSALGYAKAMGTEPATVKEFVS